MLRAALSIYVPFIFSLYVLYDVFKEISIILRGKLKRKCVIMQIILITFHLHRNYSVYNCWLFLAPRDRFQLILCFFANYRECPSLANLLKKYPLSDKHFHRSVPTTFRNWSQLVFISSPALISHHPFVVKSPLASGPYFFIILH